MSVPRATEDALRDTGLLAGRCLLVFIFLHEGWSLIGSYAGAAAYMQKSGVPSLLLPAVIALQLGGGLLVAAGVTTRSAALLFAAFCVLTALLIPLAVCRSQPGAAFPEGPGDRRRISRSGLLRTGKLVVGPVPRSVPRSPGKGSNRSLAVTERDGLKSSIVSPR